MNPDEPMPDKLRQREEGWVCNSRRTNLTCDLS